MCMQNSIVEVIVRGLMEGIFFLVYVLFDEQYEMRARRSKAPLSFTVRNTNSCGFVDVGRPTSRA